VDKEIYTTIAELGNFFQQLCCKTLKLDVLPKLKTDIPIILCKLEKIFPPTIFDVMVHLVVHLPGQAILRVPVQYGWMYLVKTSLCTLKCSVRNQAMPEGSIAEAYVANEALTFSSRYFAAHDVATLFNHVGRNRENIDFFVDGASCFDHNVQVHGAGTTCWLGSKYDKVVWYVLNKCEEVKPYISSK
jgi:hypothetical protein